MSRRRIMGHRRPVRPAMGGARDLGQRCDSAGRAPRAGGLGTQEEGRGMTAFS